MGRLRIAYQNHVLKVGNASYPSATLTASSSATGLPVSNLLDQLRSKVWQSALGWVVVAGVNDKIDFVEGGVAKVATLTAGTYATGALFAAHVQTRINAASTNTYTVTYTVATHLFQIQRTAGAATIAFPWITGANAATSAGKDLGYTADDSGATLYVADLATYLSRQWVRVDLGAAFSATLGAILGHNLSSSGTARIQSSTSSTFSPLSTNQILLAGTADDMRLVYFNADSKQHWRVLIDDVTNAEGIAELGAWYVGGYVEPSIRPSINLSRERDELSAVSHAIDGANHADARPVRDVWSLEWLEAVEADLVILEAVADAMPPGRDFWVTFDADDPTNDTQYGYFVGNMTFAFVPWNYWTISARFAEALG